jgi:hypothetical protein
VPPVFCTEPLNPIDADHLTIVKPTDQNSASYRALKEAFLETTPPKPIPPPKPDSNSETFCIFDRTWLFCPKNDKNMTTAVKNSDIFWFSQQRNMGFFFDFI